MRRSVWRFGSAVFAFALGSSAAAAEIGADCAFNGLKLWGDVEVVESFPDIKVEIVDSFPDLRVQIVDSFPDKCGKWKFVTSFPAIRVQFVTSFPDLRIQYVESFPGRP
jgi:hypothetical protein